MRGEALFKAVISGKTKGGMADVMRTGLRGLSTVYETIVEKRNKIYNNPANVYNPSIPVVSVGNITVGGTGKTPMVRYVCQCLEQLHKKAAVLSRGYKADNNKTNIVVSRWGTVEVSSFVSGDEAWLLAKTLPRTSVVIGVKRSISAQIAEKELGADILVLDDGFQHRSLHRDFDVVLIDATNPFGYDHVLPRGLLREPLKNLQRADYILFTKVNQTTAEEFESVKARVKELVPYTPVGATIHKNIGIQCIKEWAKNGPLEALQAYKEKKLLAVSGIGQPESFKASLGHMGYTVEHMLIYGDHYDYKEKDIVHIWQTCFAKGLDGIITTEKDAVKLWQLQATKDLNIPIYVLVIGIEFIEGEEEFQRALEKVATRTVGNR